MMQKADLSVSFHLGHKKFHVSRTLRIIADSVSTPKCNIDYTGFIGSFLGCIFSRDRRQISKYHLPVLSEGP